MSTTDWTYDNILTQLQYDVSLSFIWFTHNLYSERRDGTNKDSTSERKESELYMLLASYNKDACVSYVWFTNKWRLTFSLTPFLFMGGYLYLSTCPFLHYVLLYKHTQGFLSMYQWINPELMQTVSCICSNNTQTHTPKKSRDETMLLAHDHAHQRHDGDHMF